MFYRNRLILEGVFGLYTGVGRWGWGTYKCWKLRLRSEVLEDVTGVSNINKRYLRLGDLTKEGYNSSRTGPPDWKRIFTHTNNSHNKRSEWEQNREPLKLRIHLLDMSSVEQRINGLEVSLLLKRTWNWTGKWRYQCEILTVTVSDGTRLQWRSLNGNKSVMKIRRGEGDVVMK